MAFHAILFGALLVVLGPVLYLLSEEASRSFTAFIPSGFGIALITLGLAARQDSLRMHMMHGAALLGLIGFAIPTFMVVRSLVINGHEFNAVRHGGQLTMAALCLIFVVLCIKSFIDARIARKQKEAESQPPASV